MKSDKDVQLNRGRVVYRLTQRSTVIDAEEEIIQDNTPIEKEGEKPIVPNTKKEEDTANKEITS
jgi:hypothetical protein